MVSESRRRPIFTTSSRNVRTFALLLLCTVLRPTTAARLFEGQPKIQSGGRLTCKSLSGQSVDWWILLKLPNGVSYVYIDSDTIAACPEGGCWIAKDDLNAEDSPLRRSMQPLTDQSSNSHFIYNDEDSTGVEHFTFAHSKGLVGFNSLGGFWVQHSFPGYPSPPNNPDFSIVARNHLIYGQHAFCLTLGVPAVDDVARILLVARPYVYSSKMQPQLASHYPHVQDFLKNKFSRKRELFSIPLWSAKQFSLTAVSKPGFLHVPLHEAGVETACNCSMQWETWRHGPSAMPSFCPPNSPVASLNIQTLTYTPTTSWSSMHDHAKWGLSVEGAVGLVCLGDQNREYSQQNRGGMFLCTKNDALWEAFPQHSDVH